MGPMEPGPVDGWGHKVHRCRQDSGLGDQVEQHKDVISFDRGDEGRQRTGRSDCLEPAPSPQSIVNRGTDSSSDMHASPELMVTVDGFEIAAGGYVVYRLIVSREKQSWQMNTRFRQIVSMHQRLQRHLGPSRGVLPALPPRVTARSLFRGQKYLPFLVDRASRLRLYFHDLVRVPGADEWTALFKFFFSVGSMTMANTSSWHSLGRAQEARAGSWLSSDAIPEGDMDEQELVRHCSDAREREDKESAKGGLSSQQVSLQPW